MLGKRRELSEQPQKPNQKKKKMYTTEEVTAFATPDESALVVEATALTGAEAVGAGAGRKAKTCLLYTSPSPRD